MLNKLIKLHWMRPSTIKYPKIWRTFEARDWNGDKLIEYRVEDLPESKFEDAIDHLEAFYLKDEPVSQALSGCSDAKYVAHYRMVCRSILQQKASLVCLRACSDQIVGVQTQYVITKADSFGKQAYERSQSPKTSKMYDVDSVLTKSFNVFDSHRVSEYIYLHNTAVDRRFRGRNIGLQMLDAGEANIKAVHGVFTSDFSNAFGDELGFKQDLAINFDELNKRHPELGIKNIKSTGLSLMSLLL